VQYSINSSAGIESFVQSRIQDRSEPWTFYVALQFATEKDSADFLAAATKSGLVVSSVTRWGADDWRLQVTLSMVPTPDNVTAAQSDLDALLQQSNGRYLLVMGGKKKS